MTTPPVNIKRKFKDKSRKGYNVTSDDQRIIKYNFFYE